MSKRKGCKVNQELTVEEQCIQCIKLCVKTINSLEVFCKDDDFHIEIMGEESVETILSYVKYYLKHIGIIFFDSQIQSDKKLKSKCGLFNKSCKLMLCTLNDYIKSCGIPSDSLVISCMSVTVYLYFVNTTQNESSIVLMRMFASHRTYRKFVFEEIISILQSIQNKKLINNYCQKTAKLIVLLIQSIPVKSINERMRENNTQRNSLDVAQQNLKEKFSDCRYAALDWIYSSIQICNEKSKDDVFYNVVQTINKILLTFLSDAFLPASYLILSVTIYAFIKITLSNDYSAVLQCFVLDEICNISLKFKELVTNSQTIQKSIDFYLRKNCHWNNIKDSDDNRKREILHHAVVAFVGENCADVNNCIFLSPIAYYLCEFYQQYLESSIDRLENNCTTIGNAKHGKKRKRGDMGNARETSYVETLFEFTTHSNISLSDSEIAYVQQFIFSINKSVHNQIQTCFVHMIRMMGNPKTILRTKAVKNLGVIIEKFPDVLTFDGNTKILGMLFFDKSPVVREFLLDLICKSIPICPSIFNEFYENIIQRTMDKNVSVRKRAVIVLHKFYTQFNQNKNLPDIVEKLISRIEDPEDTMRKLIRLTFYKMWFVSSGNDDNIGQKVAEMIYVVHLRYFKILMTSFVEDEEHTFCDEAVMSNACSKYADYIWEMLKKLNADSAIEDVLRYIETLYIFSIVNSHSVVNKISYLTRYFESNYETDTESKILQFSIKILKNVAPLIQNNIDVVHNFQDQLFKRLSTVNDAMLSDIVMCLASLTNNKISYQKIKNEFRTYWDMLLAHQKQMKIQPLTDEEKSLVISILRILGEIIRHFDFADIEQFSGSPNKNFELYEKFEKIVFYWINAYDTFPPNLLAVLGCLCIRDHRRLYGEKIKRLYVTILSNKEKHVSLKIQIIFNLIEYLKEESNRMMKNDLSWNNTISKKEDLKIMKDNEESSAVIATYSELILENFVNVDFKLRYVVAKFVIIIINQGRINPAKVIPHLSSMATDKSPIKQLGEYGLKQVIDCYRNLVFPKIIEAFKLTYTIQKMLQLHGTENFKCLRGYILVGEDKYQSMNHYLFTVLSSNKQDRRMFLKSTIKFLDTDIMDLNGLEESLYMADNFAYFNLSGGDVLFILVILLKKILISSKPLLNEFENNFQGQNNSKTLFSKKLKMVKLWTFRSTYRILLVYLMKHLRTSYSISERMLNNYIQNEDSELSNTVKKKLVLFDPKEVIDFINTSNTEMSKNKIWTKANSVYETLKQLLEEVEDKEI